MGWTMSERRPRGESHEAFFARELAGAKEEIVAADPHRRHRQHCYAAVREKANAEVAGFPSLYMNISTVVCGGCGADESQGKRTRWMSSR